MKQILHWVLAATLICRAGVLTSCKEKQCQQCQQCQQAQENNTEVQVADSAKQVVSEELIRTSQSWDGVELPD